MGGKTFVVPEVLEHESLTGLTLQSPINGGGTPPGFDSDGDGLPDESDPFPNDPCRPVVSPNCANPPA